MTGISLTTASGSRLRIILGSGGGGLRIILRGGGGLWNVGVRIICIRLRVLLGVGRLRNVGVRIMRMGLRVLIGVGRLRSVGVRIVRSRLWILIGTGRLGSVGVGIVRGRLRLFGGAMAAITTSFADDPLSRDGHIAGLNWLGDSSGDLPVVTGAGHMGGHGGHREGNGQQDQELGRGKHGERKRAGGKEGEWVGKMKRERERRDVRETLSEKSSNFNQCIPRHVCRRRSQLKARSCRGS